MKARFFLFLFFLILLVQTVGALEIFYDDSGSAIQSGPANIATVGIALVGNAQQDRVDNVQGSVTFKNVGNRTINITQVEDSLSSQFDFEVLDLSGGVTIAPGASHAFKIRVDIPHDFDAIDAKGVVGKVNVGRINYIGKVGSENLVVSAPLFVQAINQLSLEDLKVYINDRLETLSEGEDIKDVSPGDLIKVEINVKNNFIEENEGAEGAGTFRDLDLQDVSFELNIDNDKLNVNEDVDMNTIRPEQEQREEIKFTIPNDIDSASLIVRVEVTGQDENGAEHGFLRIFHMQVDQKRHDLSFQDLKIIPNEKISCGGELTFSFTLANIGKQDENDGKIVLMSEGLALQVSKDVKLKAGKTEPITFKTLIPENARAGTYIFSLKSFYNKKYQVDQKNIDIDIQNCTGIGTVGSPDSDTNNVLPPPRVVTITSESPIVVEDVPKVEKDTSLIWWIAGILLGLIIILAIVIFLVWKFAY